MYLPVEQARENVRRARLVAEYVPGVGAKCTQCGNYGVHLKHGIKNLKGNTERRYFHCPECGNRFPADLKK